MSSFLPVKVLKGIIKLTGWSVVPKGAGGAAVFYFHHPDRSRHGGLPPVAIHSNSRSGGFNKDAVVTMRYPRQLGPKYEAFKAGLLKNATIKEVSRSSRIPSGRLLDLQGGSVMVDGVMQPFKDVLKCISTDDGFIPAYDMKNGCRTQFLPSIQYR